MVNSEVSYHCKQLEFNYTWETLVFRGDQGPQTYPIRRAKRLGLFLHGLLPVIDQGLLSGDTDSQALPPCSLPRGKALQQRVQEAGIWKIDHWQELTRYGQDVHRTLAASALTHKLKVIFAPKAVLFVLSVLYQTQTTEVTLNIPCNIFKKCVLQIQISFH